MPWRGDHHHPQSSPECNDRPAGSLHTTTPRPLPVGQNTNSIIDYTPKLKEIHREMNDSTVMLRKLVQFEFGGEGGDHHHLKSAKSGWSAREPGDHHPTFWGW